MKSRFITAYTLGIVSLAAIAACSSGASIAVSPADPVLSMCQSIKTMNLGDADQTIDSANNEGRFSTPADKNTRSVFTADAAILSRDAKSLGSLHKWFQADLLGASAELSYAGSSPDGWVSDNTAVLADKYIGAVSTNCDEFVPVPAGQLAAASPAVPSRPGPGWDWALTLEVLGVYVFMGPATSLLIAFSEREKKREWRMSPEDIFWLSLAWPAGLAIIAGRLYRQVIERVKLSPDERHEDVIRERNAEIGQLQEANDQLRAAELKRQEDELALRLRTAQQKEA